jgi:hypothetical protein
MPPEALPEWVRTFTSHPLWSAGATIEDLPLLNVEAEHRTLVRQVDDFLHGAPPQAFFVSDEQMCRFSRWYIQQGLLRYGHLTVFQALEPLHHQFHELARALMEPQALLDVEAALARLPELYAACDLFIEQLYRLQRELLTH